MVKEFDVIALPHPLYSLAEYSPIDEGRQFSLSGKAHITYGNARNVSHALDETWHERLEIFRYPLAALPLCQEFHRKSAVMNDLGPSKHHLTFRYQLSQFIS